MLTILYVSHLLGVVITEARGLPKDAFVNPLSLRKVQAEMNRTGLGSFDPTGSVVPDMRPSAGNCKIGWLFLL